MTVPETKKEAPKEETTKNSEGIIAKQEQEQEKTDAPNWWNRNWIWVLVAGVAVLIAVVVGIQQIH